MILNTAQTRNTAEHSSASADSHDLRRIDSNPDRAATLTALIDRVEGSEAAKQTLLAGEVVEVLRRIENRSTEFQESDALALRVLRDSGVVRIDSAEEVASIHAADNKTKPKTSEYYQACAVQSHLLRESSGVFSGLVASIKSAWRQSDCSDLHKVSEDGGILQRVQNGVTNAVVSVLNKPVRLIKELGHELTALVAVRFSGLPRDPEERQIEKFKRIHELELTLEPIESQAETAARISAQIVELTERNREISAADLSTWAKLFRPIDSLLRMVTFDEPRVRATNREWSNNEKMIQHQREELANIHGRKQELAKIEKRLETSQKVGGFAISSTPLGGLAVRCLDAGVGADREGLKFFGGIGSGSFFDMVNGFESELATRRQLFSEIKHGMLSRGDSSDTLLRGEILAASNVIDSSSKKATHELQDFKTIVGELIQDEYYNLKANSAIASQILAVPSLDLEKVYAVNRLLNPTNSKDTYASLTLATYIAAIPGDSPQDKLARYSAVAKSITQHLPGHRVEGAVVAILARYSKVEDTGGSAHVSPYPPAEIGERYAKLYQKLEEKLGASASPDLDRAVGILLPELLEIGEITEVNKEEVDKKIDQLCEQTAKAFQLMTSEKYRWPNSSKHFDAAAIIALRADSSDRVEPHVLGITEYRRSLVSISDDDATNIALKLAYPLNSTGRHLLDLEVSLAHANDQNKAPKEDPFLAHYREIMALDVSPQGTPRYRRPPPNLADRNFRDFNDIYGKSNNVETLGDGVDIFFSAQANEQASSSPRPTPAQQPQRQSPRR